METLENAHCTCGMKLTLQCLWWFEMLLVSQLLNSKWHGPITFDDSVTKLLSVALEERSPPATRC